jgi:hypothetical protein
VSGSFYQVDLDALGKLIDSLNQAEQLMGEALGAMQADGGSIFTNMVTGGTLGTEQLDSACSGFESAWVYGLQQLQNDIKSVVQGVQQNQQAYEQVETDVAQAMDQLKAGL